jgi:hypothetical protein
MEGVVEQRTNALSLKRPRVRVRVGHSEIRGAIKSFERHAEVLQRCRSAKTLGEVEQCVRGRACTKKTGHRLQRISGCDLVVCDYVREDYGVSFGMWQVEAAAHDMT